MAIPISTWEDVKLLCIRSISLFYWEIPHVSDRETNGMPFLASMLYDPYMPMVHYWGHSAGFLPCICIDILNLMPVPAGKCCFCQAHTRLLIPGPWNNSATGMCIVQFYTFEYVDDMNIHGLEVGFQGLYESNLLNCIHSDPPRTSNLIINGW